MPVTWAGGGFPPPQSVEQLPPGEECPPAVHRCARDGLPPKLPFNKATTKLFITSFSCLSNIYCPWFTGMNHK